MTTRTMVPSLLVGLLVLATRASAAPAKLSYYGGRVISHVQIVEVNWGPNIDATVKSQLSGFYTSITQSAFLDWLEEYDTHRNGSDGLPGSNQVIGRGTFTGSFTITPSITANSITDNQIQAELAAQIAAGNLPVPHMDTNGYVDTLYMVDFPPAVSITGSSGAQSCTAGGFCSYHGSWVAPAGSLPYSGKSIPYSVHPDFNGGCASGCGSASVPFDNQTSSHSHQLAESITDTEVAQATGTARPIAWYDVNNGEIGDICATGTGDEVTVAGYTVQKEWSDVENACIGSNPSAPICSGTNGPGCRLCNPGDEGVGCVGATALCDSTPGAPLEGRCVACRDATQCSGRTPFCDATTGTCRACTAADCSGTLAVCETAGPLAGTCVACNATTSAGCPSATPFCETSSDTCVQCLSGSDCPSAMPVCDANHTCQSAGTSGGTSGGTTTGGSSSTGGGTGGTSSGGGTTGGGTTTGGTTSGGQKSGCATGGAGLVFPWFGSLLALRRRRRKAA
jgi:uncharacterized protein (TIGR03382 family)